MFPRLKAALESAIILCVARQVADRCIPLSLSRHPVVVRHAIFLPLASLKYGGWGGLPLRLRGFQITVNVFVFNQIQRVCGVCGVCIPSFPL